MNRIFINLALLLCITYNVYSQSLFDSLVEVKYLISKGEINRGEIMLKALEPRCLGCDDDEIQLLFNENKGYVLLHNSDYEKSIPYFHKTIKLYENLNIKPQNYLDAFKLIGFSYAMLGDFESAEKFYRRAFVKSFAVANRSYDYQIKLLQDLAFIYEMLGKDNIAEGCVSRVNDKEYIRITYSDWYTALGNEIQSYEKEQRYEEVEGLYDKWITGIRLNESDTSDTLALAIVSKAFLLSHKLDKQIEAQSLYSELIGYKDKIASHNKIIPFCYCNLAYSFAKNQDFNSLEEMLPTAMKYLSEVKIEGYPSCIILRHAGDGAFLQKDYKNAIKYYEQYFNISKVKESGDELSMNWLSESYNLSQKPKKAIRLLESLLRVEKQKLHEKDPMLLSEIYYNLGYAYMLQDKPSDAIRYFSLSKDLQLELSGEVNENTLRFINECSENE